MKDIVIIGAGGLGRETAQLVKDINADKKTWNLLGFVDETPQKQGAVLNNNVVLGNFDWINNNISKKIWYICAIGNSKGRFNLVTRLKNYHLNYTNLIHPNARVNKYIQIGAGCIICSNSFLSVNTKTGNHVLISPGCGIGHDTVIYDFATLYWDVILSGNVTIREGAEIGSKADVIPQRSVGNWSIIGAGAVITQDIPDHCTAVGVPAKPIYFKTNH